MRYENVPKRFIPEELPQQSYGNPRINHLAYNNENLNAAYELLDRGIEENDWAERTAVESVDTGRNLSYGDLRSMVNRLAAALLNLGIEDGDRVLWRIGEIPEAVAVHLGVWKAGGVTVPCPLAERAREIEYYLNDTEARFVVTVDDGFEELESALREVETVETVVGVNTEKGDETFKSLLEEGDGSVTHRRTAPFDLASIFYTGGTTGRPKGCMHSHIAEVAITELEAGEGRALSPDDVVFCPAPIGHSLGSGELINFPYRFGARAILAHRPTPVEMLEIMAEREVTVFVGSPTMLRMMMTETDVAEYDLSELRLMVIGGEMFDAETFKQWKEATGIEPCNTVGMSQLRHWFLTSYRGGEKFAPELSVGKPYAGFEVKLVDIEEPARDLDKRDTVGRLAIRGPANIAYWNNIHPEMPDAMDDYRVGSWGLADDAYRQDEDGYLYFETRLDNMIVTGGRQISGPEVEDVLVRHEAVQDIAVVGSPDKQRGEIVKAFVVPNQGITPNSSLINSLQEYAKAEMSPYKYPREIEFIDELPKDEMGKIQRAQLRKREESD